MRILVSGGGTAGHVSPVLATVDALRSLDNHPVILYIGQRGGVEAGLAAAAGLPFKGIFGGKIRRLPGAGLSANVRQWRHLVWNLRDMLMIAVGTVQALWIISRFRPQVIFNKSGPPGFPVGFAAWLLRIPMVLHEPDVAPGLGTRVMGGWAAAIATGFPANLYSPRLQPKLRYTGNPVQPAIFKGDKRRACEAYGFDPSRLMLLVVGGSQGARAINTALMTHVIDLLEHIQILHVTGRLDAKRVAAAGMLPSLHDEDQGSSSGYHAVPYLSISQMADAYAAADIVVARAGGSTIAELAALGKPAILVPNTLAAAHQQANAKAIAAAGAALLCTEDPDELKAAIVALANDEDRQKALAQAMKGLHTPEAAARIAELIVKTGSRG